MNVPNFTPQPQAIDAYFAAPDVHETQREQKGGAVALVLALIFGLIDGWNVYAVVHEAHSLVTAIVIHGILTVVLAIIAMSLSRLHRENRFMLLLFVGFAMVGPYGAAGVVLTVLQHLWYTRFSQPFAEWFESIFPSIALNATEQMYENIVLGRDEASKTYSVIPFMDVMTLGNETQKRQALAKMTSQFDASFAPAFKMALADASNTIRVQAATAISKIENAFLDKLMKLTVLYSNNKKDPIVVYALAKHYDDYAYTGILDADREDNNRDMALKTYKEYLELVPDDTNTRACVGRMLMRMGNYKEAADWLKRTLDSGHRSAPIVLWYHEALYQTGRYAELRAQALASLGYAETLQPTDPDLADAIRLWAGSTQAERAAS